MRYDFDKNIAKEFGVEEAIMYENIAWWCHKNATERSEVHFHEGHYWTWNTEEAWSELFGFWTGKQCSRILSNLEKAGLLVTGMFNKKGYDRTKWYRPKTPVYAELQAKSPNGLLDKTKRATPSAQTGAPIPDSINTDNTETQKLQAASRPVVDKKKLECWEEKEQIPGWDTLNSIYQGAFTVWYGLGWKFPKRDDLEDYKKRIKTSLIKSGLADTTSQGTVAPHATLIEVELMRFRDHWRDKGIKLPLKAWETWTNNMAAFREKRR
jgi:hypothetical protein